MNGWIVENGTDKSKHPELVKTFGSCDALLILLITALSGGSVFYLKDGATPRTVEILRDSRLIAKYPLSETRTVAVTGANGLMRIRIENNSVRVLQSNCRCRICMRSSAIKTAGAQIVCVPNRVAVRIAGPKKPEAVDAVAR